MVLHVLECLLLHLLDAVLHVCTLAVQGLLHVALLGELVVASLLKGVKVAGVVVQLLAVEVHNVGSDGVEEGAVVGDDHNDRLQGCQVILCVCKACKELLAHVCVC